MLTYDLFVVANLLFTNSQFRFHMHFSDITVDLHWPLNFVMCNILLGVKGVQVEEIWSFDPESFSQIK